MQARPKRGAAQKANYVINYITLNFKEEQDLRKAIQASLSEARTSRRSTNVSTSSEVEEKDDDKGTGFTGKRSQSQSLPIIPPVLASVVKKNEKRSSSPASSRDNGDNSTSMSLPEKKKPKIPSQRKFAQNSTSLGSSTNTTPVKFGPFTPLMPTNEIFPAIRPATEDFLTFLCLRKTSCLPRNLNMFALNEEAMKKRKNLKSPTPKANQTPVKTECTQGTSASTSNTTKTKAKPIELNVPSSSGACRSAGRSCNDKTVKTPSPCKSAPKSTVKSTAKNDVKKTTSSVQSKSNKSPQHSASLDRSSDEESDSEDDTSSDDETSREKIIAQNKSKVNSEPEKRITRSTSGVTDDNVQTPSPTKDRKKLSNSSGKKSLSNSFTCKKKPASPQSSPTRSFVLDRVTRSIKHLRSMEESSRGKSSHKH